METGCEENTRYIQLQGTGIKKIINYGTTVAKKD